MPSKLSRYCEGIMESAWLAAVILIPLFFNVYSSRIFEPDKIAILRSLALLILAAWLIKLIDEGGPRWERFQSGNSLAKFITKIPLIIPVSALAILYIISTIFSITPRVSLLGSYQRLQGTYTTLSYLVIFLSIIGNLRRREQVERLITTIVLTSLPVSLYGILQRYKIDPVPWGGDTSRRIASFMGNSIFVAAYLIMVFPLALGRIVRSFGIIIRGEGSLWIQMARSTVYVFIAVIQLVAIYMSGSRGPALGWMAGSFFLLLLLSIIWMRRWLTFSIIGGAISVGIFLLIFNLPSGPLTGLRESPAIGRFGLLLDAESNSALVRKYIWQGAVELVKPHDPLEFPDGQKDPFNFLRPVIGYGPESMYVAYNPFYVPALAQVERRNASPDRSHNETWDAVVITGFLGVIVYLFLFSFVFYYGLKWVGLIVTSKQRNLFLVLLLGGGLIGAIGFYLWRGLEYIGVGLPFGMLLGFLAYLTIGAIFFPSGDTEKIGKTSERSVILIVLIAAIVSHFVEINFGIAIASTRTYFWIYLAMLICVGYILPAYGEFEESNALPVNGQINRALKLKTTKQSKKKRRERTSKYKPDDGFWIQYRSTFVNALIISIVMITLGYAFIANPNALKSSNEVLWNAFTTLPNRGDAISYGILALIGTSWIMMMVVLVSESYDKAEENSIWIRLAWTFGLSLVFTFVYWLIHAGTLASVARSVASDIEGVMAQIARYEGLLTKFYIYALFSVLTLALFLEDSSQFRVAYNSFIGISSAIIGFILVLILSTYTNLRVIQADIVFKLAEPFTRGNQWPIAIQIYNRANDLAPNEDYYYLFLGRAYLEYAKTIQDPDERQKLVSQAEKDLLRAQEINPLNTDHTANLARLYNLWSAYSSDPNERNNKAETSSHFFSRAVVLSPNNARLWDEWGLLLLNTLQEPREAYNRFLKSLEIDPEYHWTYALIGEYYMQEARSNENRPEVDEAFSAAAENYEKALELTSVTDSQSKYNYSLALGGIYTQLNDLNNAIDSYKQAVELASPAGDIWRLEEAIASLYAQTGDNNNALLHIQMALSNAPDEQKERLQSLINRLQNSQP